MTEWWEGGDDPDFPPYTFDIQIDANRSIDEEFYSDVLNLVDALKNKRSHLRKGSVAVATRGCSPFIGGAVTCGTTVTVRPFTITDMEAYFIHAVGGAMTGVVSITVYPVETE